jgi:hypothetical protein
MIAVRLSGPEIIADTARICDVLPSAKNRERCHSERSEESLFAFSLNLNRRGILRFAQNDSTTLGSFCGL